MLDRDGRASAAAQLRADAVQPGRDSRVIDYIHGLADALEAEPDDRRGRFLAGMGSLTVAEVTASQRVTDPTEDPDAVRIPREALEDIARAAREVREWAGAVDSGLSGSWPLIRTDGLCALADRLDAIHRPFLPEEDTPT